MRFPSDRRFFKAMGEGSKISEKLYPQFLGAAIPVNPPAIFKIMFPIVSKFMSKKMIEKVVIITAISLA